MSSSDSIPDVVGTLTGYRVWPILKSDLGYVLGSYHDNCIWIPGQAARASCRDLCRDVPGSSCSCGLYGVTTPKEAVNNLVERIGGMFYERSFPGHDTGFIAYGKVDLWGRVVEHEYAYRAEFAYPKEISIVYKDFETARTPATGDIGLHFKEEPEAQRIAESISSLYKIPAAPISSGDEVYKILYADLNTLGRHESQMKQILIYRAWARRAQTTHMEILDSIMRSSGSDFLGPTLFKN